MFPKNKPFFIIETAWHHEGDVTFFKKMIEDYSRIKSDSAIKIHLLFDREDYIISSHPANDVIRTMSIEKEIYPEIFQMIEGQSKGIITLCNDVESMKWVNSIQEDYKIIGIEIHSTGLNDIFLLQEALNFKKTIILGIGGSTFDEIQYAVDFLKNNGKNDILLVHGFQNYPTDYSEINFRRLLLIKEVFQLPVAYADHTDPQDKNNVLVSILPQMLGANILEKHVTNEFGKKRIDSQSAVSIDTMNEIISLANIINLTLGKSAIELSEAEKNYGDTGPMKKAIVARQNIEKDSILTLENIAFKRTLASSPLTQKDIQKILGCEASTNIEKDQIITYANVNYKFNKAETSQFFASSKD